MDSSPSLAIFLRHPLLLLCFTPSPHLLITFSIPCKFLCMSSLLISSLFFPFYLSVSSVIPFFIPVLPVPAPIPLLLSLSLSFYPSLSLSLSTLCFSISLYSQSNVLKQWNLTERKKKLLHKPWLSALQTSVYAFRVQPTEPKHRKTTFLL